MRRAENLEHCGRFEQTQDQGSIPPCHQNVVCHANSESAFGEYKCEVYKKTRPSNTVKSSFQVFLGPVVFNSQNEVLGSRLCRRLHQVFSSQTLSTADLCRIRLKTRLSLVILLSGGYLHEVKHSWSSV